MENQEIHPFQKSGLGQAPFRFNSYTIDSKGTSCQHCGAYIKNVFWITSKDGNYFKVGSSCVEKTDLALYKEVKAARNQYLKQIRDERRELGLKAWRDAKIAKQQTNLENFKNSFPEVFNFLELNQNKNDFFFSLFNSIRVWGNLSEKQMVAVTKAMNPVISNYVGEIGKKMEFSLTISNILSFEGQWGTIYMFIMEDSKGNKVVYKGSASFSMEVPEEEICNGEKVIFTKHVPACQGDSVVLTAKVKNHAEYKGTKQTIIERFKVKEIIKK